MLKKKDAGLCDLELIEPDQLLSSQTVYSGKVIDLKIDTVRLRNGKEVQREIISHPGAVAIVPCDEQGNILMIRQYRHASGQVLWEIPAGKLEAQEDPDDCARRELAEETGYTPIRLEKLTEFFTAPGFASELIHLYLAEGLQEAMATQDEDEDIVASCLSLNKCLEMIYNGEIADAKTIVGILMLARIRHAV